MLPAEQRGIADAQPGVKTNLEGEPRHGADRVPPAILLDMLEAPAPTTEGIFRTAFFDFRARIFVAKLELNRFGHDFTNGEQQRVVSAVVFGLLQQFLNLAAANIRNREPADFLA